ncbi:hypothetical protein SLEP1_g51541 [Rubroshorea leprosula]|uniref:Uncharacterized protein n=1 Tax=Rubroshorea leprosula TaxID=152421 RepID=A0AAV5M6T7_9ROSI|nr:hypothetical protein SLEP1_g51541 [Rubroshorea leprosula]
MNVILLLTSSTCTLYAVLEWPGDVSPSVLKSSTGLDVSKLSPKKWGSSGTSSTALVALLGGVSYLLSQGIDIRPNLAAILGLALLDSIFLGGTFLALISNYWPPYSRWMLVYEAGHLLVGIVPYGLRNSWSLDPIAATQMGIQGQAGTQFWDEKMSNELAQ